MNYKALALGAAIGFAMALIPSCGGAKCSAANCNDGCCDAQGKCVKPANTNQACGTSGQACKVCATNETCNAGQCTPGTGGGAGGGGGGGGGAGGGSGGGGGSACATGCVATGGTCVPGTTPTNCGANGQACQTCPSGQNCVAVAGGGQCQTPGVDAGIGAPCNTDGDCNAGTQCRKTTATDAGTYQGGYCTKVCSQASPCPAGSTCIRFSATLDEPQTLCVANCSQPDTIPGGCRSGYACYPVSQTQGVCWIYPPPPQLDAGIADKVGNPCTMDSQCQNPPLDGFCFLPTFPDGGPTGFNQGYCSADCEDNAKCGDGGVCVGLGQNFAACFSSCPAPNGGQSTCRAGYVCDALFQTDGGMLPFGICWPNCNNPGFAAGVGCGQGQTCNTTTGYCQ